MKTEVSYALAAMQSALPSHVPNTTMTTIAPSLNLGRGNCGTILPIYKYVDTDAIAKKKVGKKQVFAVPYNFAFPAPFVKNTWIIWFYGLVDNMSAKQDGSVHYSALVKPFMLPQKKRHHFNSCWSPIIIWMQRAVEGDDLIS